MKNSNEWIRDIKEKADIRCAEQKRRRKIIASVSSSVACFALILCAAFMLPNMLGNTIITGEQSSDTNSTHDNGTPTQPSDKQLDNSKIDTLDQNDNSTKEPSKPNVILLDFTINKIMGQMSGARPYLDPNKHHKETWTAQQMSEYLGVDLTQLSPYIPKDLSYVGRNDFTVTFNNDGSIVEDFASFSYTGAYGRKITILASKIGKPYDTVYSLETNNTEKINGKQVLIGGMSKNGVSDDYNFFYADFENQGISYRVKADNLTGEEFYQIVKSILELD